MRAAVADALRGTVTADTTHALVELAADPARAVGTLALSALGGRALDDDALGELETQLLAGQIAIGNQGALAHVLVARMGQSPAAARLAQELRDTTRDPQLAGRLTSLLGPAPSAD